MILSSKRMQEILFAISQYKVSRGTEDIFYDTDEDAIVINPPTKVYVVGVDMGNQDGDCTILAERDKTGVLRVMKVLNKKNKLMQEFKEGDLVELKNGCVLFKKENCSKILKKRSHGLGLSLPDGSFECVNESHWQLISPKERTIDDVEVGDILENRGSYSRVLTKNGGSGDVQCIGISYPFEHTGHNNLKTFCGIFTIYQLKKDGWKIKQPEEKESYDGTHEIMVFCRDYIYSLRDSGFDIPEGKRVELEQFMKSIIAK